MVIHGQVGGVQVRGLISPYENRVSRTTVGRVYYGLSTYLDSEHNLSVTRTPAMKRLGCRWVGTCASSSDASPLYIHDRSNVVQWKGSSLPSSQCTSSDQCIFGKMCSDESRNWNFLSWRAIRTTMVHGPSINFGTAKLSVISLVTTDDIILMAALFFARPLEEQRVQEFRTFRETYEDQKSSDGCRLIHWPKIF